MKPDQIGAGIAVLFDENSPEISFEEVVGRSGVTQLRPSGPTAAPAWFRRGPVLAGLTTIAILLVATPLLLLTSGGPSDHGDVATVEPLAVGVDYVWPEGGFVGTSDEIASAFAETALGWTDAIVTAVDPSAPESGPVWTTISHGDSPDFDVLSVPLNEGDGRRVLIQVGSAVINASPGEIRFWLDPELEFPSDSDPTNAILHIRLVDPDRVVVVRATEDDLAARRVKTDETSDIGGVVIIYLDAEGEPLTAIAGHFGPLPTTPDADVTATTMAPDPLLEAELISRAIGVACGQTCTEQPTFIRESHVNIDDLTGEQEMPEPVSDAIRNAFPNVAFINPSQTEQLNQAYADSDNGTAVVINVSPVRALAERVFGVDVGVSFNGFHGQTIQFQWDGSDWVVADTDQTGVTVTSVVS